jgi:hypothetical protein
METKGKEKEDDPYSLEVGGKDLEAPHSQLEDTLLAQDKGKIILVKSLPPQSRGTTHRLATSNITFKLSLKKILELPKAAFKPLKGKVIQGPFALLVGEVKEKVKCHGLLKPQVENISNESLSFLSLNFELIQVVWNCPYIEWFCGKGLMGEQIGICCTNCPKGENKMHNVAFSFSQCASGRGHC